MAQSVTISDLKINVRLNSKSAHAGLKRLERQMKTFQSTMKHALRDEMKKVKLIQQQVDGTGQAVRKQKQLNTEVKKTVVSSEKLKANIGGLGKLTLLYGAIRGLTSIYNLMQSIADEGMRFQSSVISINAAVGATDQAQGMSPKGLKRLQKDQRQFIQHLAKDYGLDAAASQSEYAKFFAAASPKMGSDGTQDLFKGLSELGVVYGLSQDKMGRAMTAFTQMASKNQVMAEELKQQLGDVLPGSMEIFARAMTEMGTYGTVTVKELYSLMEQGKVVASDVLPAVSREMSRMAHANGALSDALSTTGSQLNRLKTGAQFASAGIFNQFDLELGNLFKAFTKALNSFGLQTVIGHRIRNLVVGLHDLLQTVFDRIDEFERRWNEATEEGKKSIIDEDFYGVLLAEMATFIAKLTVKIAQAIGDAFGRIDEKDLDALFAVFRSLTDILVEGLLDAIQRATGVNLRFAKKKEDDVPLQKKVNSLPSTLAAKNFILPAFLNLFKSIDYFNKKENTVLEKADLPSLATSLTGLTSNWLSPVLGGKSPVSLQQNITVSGSEPNKIAEEILLHTEKALSTQDYLQQGD